MKCKGPFDCTCEECNTKLLCKWRPWSELRKELTIKLQEARK